MKLEGALSGLKRKLVVISDSNEGCMWSKHMMHIKCYNKIHDFIQCPYGNKNMCEGIKKDVCWRHSIVVFVHHRTEDTKAGLWVPAQFGQLSKSLTREIDDW